MKDTMSYTKYFKKIAAGLAAVLVVAAGCNSGPDYTISDPELGNAVDSASYSLGFQNGSFLANQGMDDVNLEAVMAGLRDALQEKDPKLSNSEMMSSVRQFQTNARQKAQAKRQEESQKNMEEGQEFLARNKNKPGINTTESGLQYKVLEEGSGESPSADDTVTVHYEGTLIDGTVFDSSYERGEPISFPLSRVIRGWTEGVQLMKEGATYKFFIPSELAYGANPRPGGPIGPNETLIFKVELIEVE